MSSGANLTPTWFGRPTCTEYLSVNLGAVGAALMTNGGTRRLDFQWALGTTCGGESEILGWWVLGASWPDNWAVLSGELAKRGLQRVGWVVVHPSAVERGIVFDRRRKTACLDAGKEITFHALPSRPRTGLAAASSRAQRAGRLLSRSLSRRGPFENKEAAAAFVDQQLQRLDRHFWGGMPELP